MSDEESEYGGAEDAEGVEVMSDEGRISPADRFSSSESGEGEESDAEVAPDEERARPATRADAVLRVANTPVVVREVPAGSRATASSLTVFEVASLVAMRAAQIDRGGAIFVELSPELVEGGTLTAEKIALLELEQRRMPLLVRRTIYTDGTVIGVETINPREAALPPLPDL